MKKNLFILIFLLCSTAIISQTASSTYTAGDIPTTYIASASVTTSSNATEPGTLTVTIPTGNTTITSIDVAYQMTARNTAYIAEQRSFVKCVSTGGNTEAEVYSGVGNSEGTYSYNRTNLDIANSVTNGGDIEFELHAFRTYFDDGSNTTHQYVNNNSWSITVNYNYVEPPTNPSNPTNFVQTAKGASQIALTLNKNANDDNVMIAVNATNSFGVPIDGSTYSVGNSIVGGGTVIYNSGSAFFNHVDLETLTTYYYKIWSVDENNLYSTGVEGSATTVSNPTVSNVTFTNTDGIVDVYYNVTDGEESTFTIYMEASDDGGVTYDFLCTQITGDVGANVSIGTNKHIIWNFGREHSGVVGDNFRIKIIADDLYGDQVYYAGKIYKTITIGTQTWFKDNLNIGMMINSTEEGFQQTDNNIIEKYCYNNDASNCDTYGGLYEWTEAMQYISTEGTQGICPIGWHIPKYSEFETLKTYTNAQSTQLIDQNARSGYAYRNETGFSSIFAGNRYVSGGGFGQLSIGTDFWCSTESSATGAYALHLYFSDSNISFRNYYKYGGFSIRCLKD